ncbi:20633_t:CDS:2 [Cetraspora pellucida]|uniref:20633_t:CDS:1 n=1 Tax=Cetraspora pellucida TaxID=1433469 RepID=A0A9N9CMH6_9GLOM|nr:20633_t:CDS:2 [Cetraspora pellucida]
MPNDSQNITSTPNSFSTSDSFPHPYNYTTVTNINVYETTETIETTENLQNIQPSSYFHNEQIMPTNDQNRSSFSTNDLYGSFYSEILHLYINPYDEAIEASQNFIFPIYLPE